MSTHQSTLGGDFIESDDEETCPLCGTTIASKVQLPDHIASDECDTEHKEVSYR